ncbi:MAG: hypothetical protein P8J84_06785 [Paracoccaceae bacterium]|nr:hypothetical protein [Paracoccaceae bacterium]
MFSSRNRVVNGRRSKWMLYRPVAAPNPTQPPFLDVRFLSGVVVFYMITLILWVDTFVSHMGVIGLIISLLFGVFMAALAIKSKLSSKTTIAPLKARYNLEKPTHHYLYFAMPFFVILVIFIDFITARSMTAPIQPDDGNLRFISLYTLYLLILMSGLTPLYQRQNHGSWAAKIGGTRLLGMIILGFGVYFLVSN